MLALYFTYTEAFENFMEKTKSKTEWVQEGARDVPDGTQQYMRYICFIYYTNRDSYLEQKMYRGYARVCVYVCNYVSIRSKHSAENILIIPKIYTLSIYR